MYSSPRRAFFDLYLLLVCLASLIGMVVAVFMLVKGLLSLIDPELMLSSYTYEQHQTNDRYWKNNSYHYKPSDRKSIDPQADYRPPEAELTQLRFASLEIEIASERREGKKFAVFSTVGLLIAAVVFVIHWRLARNVRQTLG